MSTSYLVYISTTLTFIADEQISPYYSRLQSPRSTIFTIRRLMCFADTALRLGFGLPIQLHRPTRPKSSACGPQFTASRPRTDSSHGLPLPVNAPIITTIIRPSPTFPALPADCTLLTDLPDLSRSRASHEFAVEPGQQVNE